MSLNKSIQSYDESIQKSKRVYSGLLGLAIGGARTVNISSRAGYVYVRLRDNLSEVIQAYNDKVSPVYDFPVLLERRGNKWYITGRDDARYESFGTPAPFLPQHGDSHSFNRDGGGGGDAVFIYPDQFVPLLVYPSGTYGASNLMVAPYVLQRNADFVYVGNTGTGNLLVYKPSNSQAIVGLVYLDKNTGNPGVLVASGTPIAGTITGTAAILPYLPYPSSSQEPLYAFRLVSGTSALNWSNLYNVRQFYGGSSTSTGSSGGGGISGVVVQDEGIVQGTGTVFNFVGDNVSVSVSGSVARVYVTGSAGGGSVPSFITGSIPYAGANGVLKENNELLWWDETFRGFRLGPRSTRYSFADTFPIGITAKNADETISIGLYVYGTGSSGAPSALWNGYRSRGTPSNPLPVKAGDIFSSIVGRGYDGSSFTAQARVSFFATGDAITGTYAPTGIDFLVIPSGGFSSRSQLTIYGDSVNIPTGSTYNVGGTPHTHDPLYAIIAKNSSGATAILGDVGYIDSLGEYRTTTTAEDTVAWCVVTSGGANGSDITVARRGRVFVNYTGTAPSSGHYLSTSTVAGKAQRETAMHPSIFAVCIAAGSGGTVQVQLLCLTSFRPLTKSTDILRLDSSSNSNFVATINGAPSGSNVTYNAPSSGAEDAIKPASSSEVGNLVLANTTRGTSALIDSVNTGTNVITLTAAVPAGWASGDSITIRSQTYSTAFNGTSYLVEVDLTGCALTLTRSVALSCQAHDSGTITGNVFGFIHKLSASPTFASGVSFIADWAHLILPAVELVSNKIMYCVGASGSGTMTYFIIRLNGVWEAVP